MSNSHHGGMSHKAGDRNGRVKPSSATGKTPKHMKPVKAIDGGSVRLTSNLASKRSL